MRHHSLLLSAEGKDYPTLPLAMFLATGPPSSKESRVSDPAEGALRKFMQTLPGFSPPQTQLFPQPGPLVAPMWRDPRAGIDGCGVYGGVDLYSLVNEDLLPYDKEGFKDAYVLIGVSNDYLGDTISVPNFDVGAGILLHATLLDALVRPNGFVIPLRRFSAARFLPHFALLLLGGLILLSQIKLGVVAGAFVVGLAFFAGEALFFGLFLEGYLAQTGLYVGGFPMLLASCYALSYWYEGREKALIKQLFGKQVSPDIVEVLLEDPSQGLIPQRRDITVAFFDVCGFTSFSEKHSPGRVLLQLNHYFSSLVRIVHANKGTLDKFIGDAMMVMTGAPLSDEQHALNMIRLGIGIREEIWRINKNLPKGIFPFTVSCGMNSGEAILGNIGSAERMEYTVIGDTVNLASRLQGKAGSQEIVIGPKTFELVREHVIVEALEPFQVKGKNVPIQAYLVLRMKETV